MTKICFILIGLPGSGKSTLAQQIATEAREGGATAAIHSTDSFFVDDETGEYKFVPERLEEFHDANLSYAIGSMDHGVNVVIIDNTNLERRYRASYVTVAKQRGYQVLYRAVGDFTEEAALQYAKRCSHGVPEETILAMVPRVELPGATR